MHVFGATSARNRTTWAPLPSTCRLAVKHRVLMSGLQQQSTNGDVMLLDCRPPLNNDSN